MLWCVYNDLEPNIDHVFRIEWHGLNIHIFYRWILHHAGINSISMTSWFVSNPWENNSLFGFDFDHFRKRYSHTFLKIITYTFPIFQSSMLMLYLATHSYQSQIFINLVLRNSQYESVDIFWFNITSRDFSRYIIIF